MVYRIVMDDAGFKVIASVSSAASGAVSLVTADWSVALFGVPFPVLAAGFAGALIAVAMMPPLSKWWVILAAGTGISAYTTSLFALIIDKFTTLGDLDDRVVAFLVGLLAYFLISMVFQDGRDIVLGFLRARLGIAPKAGDE